MGAWVKLRATVQQGAPLRRTATVFDVAQVVMGLVTSTYVNQAGRPGRRRARLADLTRLVRTSCRAVLIRPDGHGAWRTDVAGLETATEFRAVLQQVPRVPGPALLTPAR